MYRTEQAINNSGRDIPVMTVDRISELLQFR